MAGGHPATRNLGSMNPSCTEDAALLQQAAAHGAPSLAQLTPEIVQQLTRQHGIDFATALLYDRLRKSPQHAEFIDRLEAGLTISPTRLRSVAWTIAIVPGALYLERPELGGDGKIVREAAEALGIKTVMVPLASRGSVTENATRLAHWLQQQAAEKLVLVSLSKGGPDLKEALARPDAGDIFGNVVAWVNVCGPLDGTHVVNWVLDSWWRSALLKLQYRLQRRDFAFLTELRRAAAFPVALPPAMQLISLVGFPLQKHLTTGLSRFCHRIIGRLGPNDGTVALADAIRWPGAIYPVWGADHYFQPADRARALIKKVLWYLGETNEQPGGSDIGRL